ncbi:MAG: lipid II flippase MurJ [Elusimicrobiales bacterium]|nr:lipid II flippase MurJ [Elusimicrobiales bacterium]
MKKIFLYNSVIALQTLLALGFQFAFAWRFGASALSDSYFAGMAVFSLAAGLTAFFTYMFMQYYNDIKASDKRSAMDFYRAVVTVSLLTGLGVFILLAVSARPLISVFAPGFPDSALDDSRSFLLVLGAALVWTRAVALNNSLINAEMRFLLPYLMSLAAPAFNILAVIFFSDRFGIEPIAWATLASGLLSFGVSSYFINRELGIKLVPLLWHPALPELFRKSLSIRAAYQVWSFRESLAVNFLSRFPAGNLSYYFYAVRVLSALFNVVNTPVIHVFAARASRLVSLRGFAELRRLTLSTAVRSGIFFAAACLPLVFFLPDLLRAFFSHKFSPEDIGRIHIMFLSLLPAYLGLAGEIPFSNVVAAIKMTGRTMLIYLSGLIVFTVILATLGGRAGIYAVSVSMFGAQAVVLWGFILSAGSAMSGRTCSGGPESV